MLCVCVCVCACNVYKFVPRKKKYDKLKTYPFEESVLNKVNIITRYFMAKNMINNNLHILIYNKFLYYVK